ELDRAVEASLRSTAHVGPPVRVSDARPTPAPRDRGRKYRYRRRRRIPPPRLRRAAAIVCVHGRIHAPRRHGRPLPDGAAESRTARADPLRELPGVRPVERPAERRGDGGDPRNLRARRRPPLGDRRRQPRRLRRVAGSGGCPDRAAVRAPRRSASRAGGTDRKSTRLNSSHSQISYAVFCLKKKINTKTTVSIMLPTAL